MANVKDTVAMVQACFRHRVVPLLVSSTGKGKTTLGESLSKELGVEFLCLQLSQLEPPDFVGLPSFPDDTIVMTREGATGKIVTWDLATATALVQVGAALKTLPIDSLEVVQSGKVTKHIRPDFFPDPDSTSRGIILLDEINRARTDTRAALFDFLLYRRIGKYRLPDGWDVMCAMNPPGGSYQVAKLDPALQNRFAIINYEPTSDDWLEFETKNGISPDVLSFIGSNTDELEENVDKVEPVKAERRYRTWSIIGRMHQDPSIPEHVRPELYAGIVGKAGAAKFFGWLQTRKVELSWADFLRAPEETAKLLNKKQTAAEISVLKQQLSSFFNEIRSRRLTDADLVGLNNLSRTIQVFDLVTSELRNLIKGYEGSPDEKSDDLHKLMTCVPLIDSVRERR
jgi:MoxR-like ATPase